MKILFGIFGILLTTIAVADDENLMGLADRMSCSEIQESITELSSQEVVDDSVLEEIAKLKAEYRRNCVKKTGARRSAAESRVIVNMAMDDDVDEGGEEYTEEELVETSEKIVDDVEAVHDVALQDEKNEGSGTDEENKYEEQDLLKEQLEQELENLDSGLCADGSSPNKYGCCADELFKDMGNMVFACCPKDGGDCFPPIN